MSPTRRLRGIVFLVISLASIWISVWLFGGRPTIETMPVAEQNGSQVLDGQDRLAGSANQMAQRQAVEQTPQPLEQAPSKVQDIDANVRILAGQVLGVAGPLPRGTFMVCHPEFDFGKGRDIIAAKIAEGKFYCRLPRSEFGTEFVQAKIHDGKEVVFSGLVRVLESVTIYVRSSVLDDKVRLSGSVHVPHLGPDDQWWGMVVSPGYRPVDIASSRNLGLAKGPTGVLTFIFQEPVFADWGERVILVALPPLQDMRTRGAHALATFDSVAHLRQELKLGVTMQTQVVRVRPRPLRGEEITSLAMVYPDVSMAFFRVEPRNGAFEVRASPGSYLVRGNTVSGAYGVARVSLATGLSELEVQWQHELPGEHDLSVRVVDESGSPCSGVSVTFTGSRSETEPLHRGRARFRTGDDGRADVQGLMVGAYLIEAGGDFLQGTTRVSIPNDTESTVTLRATGAVMLQVGGAHLVGVDWIDQRDCDITYRTASESVWQEVPIRERRTSGWTVGGLRSGSYEFAIRGDTWIGACRADVEAGRMGIVEVPISPMAKVSGIVVAADGRPRARVEVGIFDIAGSSSAVTPPWSCGVTAADGRFELWVSFDLIKPQLRVTEDGAVVSTQPISVLQGGERKVVVEHANKK